ncbi:MAG: signal peptidase II [Lachnospiraceae bacterium]|nr:signal peptidase II [Lachnospiraceae bacterium]
MNTKIRRVCLNTLLWLALIAIDQYTKHLAVKYLKDQTDIVIFKGVFQLTYLENSGAAFGMLQNRLILFVIIAVAMLMVVIYLLIRMPLSKRYYLLNFILLLIASGAVGNLIDRVMNNYVVDFFNFSLINFPVFNVADIYVTVACILMLIAVFFVYSEEELFFYKNHNEE